MSTPQPVTVIQSLAQLEQQLAIDLKSDFGDALNSFFINLGNVSSLTPAELAVYDAGQWVQFVASLAAHALKFAPQAQQALAAFLQAKTASWASAMTAATKK